MQKKPPLSIYIHLPWCVHKCPYCDFNSHEKNNNSFELDKENYLAAITKHIQLHESDEREIISIFFGGGTPSLFAPSEINQILLAIKNKYSLHANCEITLEANPGTIDLPYFAGYQGIGINRLSLGIQSFNDKHLKKLGRIHSAEDAFQIATHAKQIFPRVNLDLMFALPAQTMADLADDIGTALSISPEHLSYYHLTIEPNTLFHKFPPQLPDDDTSAEYQDYIFKKLSAHHYHHYETSAHTKVGGACLHNLNYWEFGDYLGFGAGAHSKITQHNSIKRFSCYKNPMQYIKHTHEKDFYIERKTVTRNELIFEFMMNVLRLNDGFKVPLFEARTGLLFTEIALEINQAQERGLISVTDDMIKPTALGQNYLNDLLQIFLRD